MNLNSDKKGVNGADKHQQYAESRIKMYAERFATCSDSELRKITEREKRCGGWTQERSYYLIALRDECARRESLQRECRTQAAGSPTPET